MNDERTVQGCRWAEPTLFQTNPLWTEGEEYFWTCKADGEPQPVKETTRCATCGWWAPRNGELVPRGVKRDELCHCGCEGCCGTKA
jgi:hypothetical protein